MERITKNMTDKKVQQFVNRIYSPDEDTDDETQYFFQSGK